MELKLGDRVRDPITGYSGIAIAFTAWLGGCKRTTVQAEGLDKDGKPKETQTFDTSLLELVEALAAREAGDTGGPCDDRAALRRA